MAGRPEWHVTSLEALGLWRELWRSREVAVARVERLEVVNARLRDELARVRADLGVCRVARDNAQSKRRYWQRRAEALADRAEDADKSGDGEDADFDN